jgi:hypothetical protein
MLGKIYSAIISSSGGDVLGKYKRIHKVIDYMIVSRHEDRYTLKEVAMEIETEKKIVNKQRKQSEN